MFNKLIILTTVILACACQDATPPNETSEVATVTNVSSKNYSLDWLVGNWLDSSTMAFRKVSYGENWIKKGDNIYNGDQYYINKGIKGEPNNVSLVKTDGLFYLTYLIGKDQHTFVQDSVNDRYLRLTHIQDKFPTKLIYTVKSDTLLMTREGFANGIFRSVTFNAIKLTD